MLLDPAASIVVLTGAGISPESGLATFRDQGGLWEQHRIEEVATPEAFEADPKLVQRFYNERRRKLLTVQPNQAHVALAELEARWPGDFLLVTQNVDDLHERAGSKNLVHMHGELRKARCLACATTSPWNGDLESESCCPKCGLNGCLRPHIVWFGEAPFYLDRIYSALERCGLFVAIGTSGKVYPAAGFVEAVDPSAHTVEINLDASAVGSRFKERRVGQASASVPEWVAELMNNTGERLKLPPSSPSI